MPDILQLARRFKDWLTKREARAQSEMLKAYEAAWTRISAEIERLTGEIKSDGGPGKLFEQERLRAIQDALAQEIARLAAEASRRTRDEQLKVIEEARTHAAEMMKAAASDASVRARIASLPTSALQHLVGMAQDGSPLDDLFKQLARDIGAESKDVLKNALIQSVAMGQNPRQAAAYVRRQVDAKGDNPQRDPKIVRKLNSTYRQSVFTSAREANRESYQANSHIVQKWRWLATHDAHTCVVCWAMDGEEFDVDTPFASHINCRCTTVPVIEGDPKPETGPEAFAKLEPGFQKQILGEKAFNAYRRGEVELSDFVKYRVDDRWGPQRTRGSLEDALKAHSGKPEANTFAEYMNGQTRLPAKETNYQKVAENIITWHEGAGQGGSTYSLYFGNQSDQPVFAASPYPDRTELIVGDLTRQSLEEFMRKHADLLDDPRHAVGTWLDEESGLTFVDVVVLLESKKMAMEFGNKYNQKGVFDLLKREFVPTGGTGTSTNGLELQLPRIQRKH